MLWYKAEVAFCGSHTESGVSQVLVLLPGGRVAAAADGAQPADGDVAVEVAGERGEGDAGGAHEGRDGLWKRSTYGLG